jgi:hypothetical protein
MKKRETWRERAREEKLLRESVFINNRYPQEWHLIAPRQPRHVSGNPTGQQKRKKAGRRRDNATGDENPKLSKLLSYGLPKTEREPHSGHSSRQRGYYPKGHPRQRGTRSRHLSRQRQELDSTKQQRNPPSRQSALRSYANPEHLAEHLVGTPRKTTRRTTVRSIADTFGQSRTTALHRSPGSLRVL